MITVRRWMLAVVTCFLLASPVFAARTEAIKEFEGETAVATLAEATDAIVSAAAVPGAFGGKVKWIFEKVKAGEIVATLFNRTYMVKVTITYDTAKYKITYRDSSNLNYDGSNIHVSYGKWVSGLKMNIDKMFTERRASASNK